MLQRILLLLCLFGSLCIDAASNSKEGYKASSLARRVKAQKSAKLLAAASEGAADVEGAFNPAYSSAAAAAASASAVRDLALSKDKVFVVPVKPIVDLEIEAVHAVAPQVPNGSSKGSFTMGIEEIDKDGQAKIVYELEVDSVTKAERDIRKRVNQIRKDEKLKNKSWVYFRYSTAKNEVEASLNLSNGSVQRVVNHLNKHMKFYRSEK